MGTSKAVVVGDFNLPKLFSNVTDPICNIFETTFSNLSLVHMNRQPTRESNCLDLVLANEEKLVFDVSVDEPFSNNDHCSVLFKIRFSDSAKKKLKIRNFRKADFDAINGYLLSVDWHSILDHLESPTDKYSAFLRVLNHVIEFFVPLSVPGKNVYSGPVKNCYFKRENWKKYHASKSLPDLERYKD